MPAWITTNLRVTLTEDELDHLINMATALTIPVEQLANRLLRDAIPRCTITRSSGATTSPAA